MLSDDSRRNYLQSRWFWPPMEVTLGALLCCGQGQHLGCYFCSGANQSWILQYQENGVYKEHKTQHGD